MQQDVQAHRQRAEHVDALLQEIASCPDAHLRATAEEFVQVLLDMYGEGLARILTLTAEQQPREAATALAAAFANDALVGSLLVLHGLHPIPIETRILRALDEVRPSIKSHGVRVDFINIDAGIAHLRLTGSCTGCSSSVASLKSSLEEAIYKAVPDLDGLHVEDMTASSEKTGVPVKFVPLKRRKEQQVTNLKLT